MTVRVVPLRSDKAGDARVGGTAAERLELLAELSQRMWKLGRKPLASYDRSSIPVRVTTLDSQ